MTIRVSSDAMCRRVLRDKVFHLAALLSIDPGDADAWYRLGTALAALGDRAGALLALRNALLQQANHLPSHLALGRLLFDCGQVEDAMRYFDNIRASSFPGEADARISLGLVDGDDFAGDLRRLLPSA